MVVVVVVVVLVLVLVFACLKVRLLYSIFMRTDRTTALFAKHMTATYLRDADGH